MFCTAVFRTAFAALFVFAGLTADVLAQAWPARTVRIIGAYSPGSGPDTTLRLIAERLSTAWGQQVLVENRPGANGILAIEAVRKSAPDGYTLVLSDNAQMTINPYLYSSLPYSVEDFTPIAVVSDAPFALLVGANSPFKTLRELVALGFVRGIMNQLDKIEKLQPECSAFVAGMRRLARQFEFEAMARQLDAPAPEVSA